MNVGERLSSRRQCRSSLPRPLKNAPLPGSGLWPIYMSARMRLDLTDWNNDGVVDLLLGNVDGTGAFLAGYRFQFTSITSAVGGGTTLQWRSAPHLSFHVLAAVSPEAAFNIVASNLPSAGNSTGWTNPASAERNFYRVQIAP